MTIMRLLLTATLALTCAPIMAAQPALESQLPVLSLDEMGELTYQGDDFKFVPWSSADQPGTVHVIQYFNATMGDSETFKPLTDLLEKNFEPGTVHVTTILNLDAAMWGTSGLVVSELKKNKLKHPGATMVVDEEGDGVKLWGLGNDGAGLAITDEQGKVKYFTTEPLSPEEINATLALIRANIDS